MSQFNQIGFGQHVVKKRSIQFESDANEEKPSRTVAKITTSAYSASSSPNRYSKSKRKKTIGILRLNS